MNIEKTIPEKIKSYRVDNIKIMLESNKAMVEIWTDFCNRKEIDLKSILNSTSKEDKIIIKNFINQIIEIALDVSIGKIPDTLFVVDSSILK